jgi:putative tryptophan/tyrosine transport system substrate-binding protein
MDRRTFLGIAAGGILAAPRAVEAQRADRAIRVAVLYPGVDNSIFRDNFAGFRHALDAAGYVEGRNLKFDVRSGDGHELAPIAADIVTLRPDLILAVARPGVVAAHTATSTIPVVALDLESDPVVSGFVRTLPKPGGNLTGVFMDFPELAGKWLEILKTMVPTLARVAILWDPATGPAQLEAARRAARLLKIVVSPVEARSMSEIEPAVRAAMRERPSGMIALTSPLFNAGRRTIIELAARYRLPTLVPFSGYAKDGGLVSYGPEVMTMYAQAGALAVKILAGRSPAEIPVERPTRFVLSLNLKTAKTLGLRIPESLLQRTDEVIP